MSTMSNVGAILCLMSTLGFSQPNAVGPSTDQILKNPAVFEELRRDKSKGTTELMERAFSQAGEHPNRRRLALELVLRGVVDSKYLKYLVDRVLFVSSYDGPDPFIYNNRGEQVRGSYSPAFLAWCSDRSIDPSEQFAVYYYGALQDIQALELTNRPEALAAMRSVIERSQSQAAVLGAARAVGRARDGRDIVPIATAANQFKQELVRKAIFLTAYEFYERPEDVKMIETVLAAHPAVLERYRSALAARSKRTENKGSGATGDNKRP